MNLFQHRIENLIIWTKFSSQGVPEVVFRQALCSQWQTFHQNHISVYTKKSLDEKGQNMLNYIWKMFSDSKHEKINMPYADEK